MADIGSNLPVPLKVEDTNETLLMWVRVKKQEIISKIRHLEQAIEDIRKGKILEIERQIKLEEQALRQLEEHEKSLTSVETTIEQGDK